MSEAVAIDQGIDFGEETRGRMDTSVSVLSDGKRATSGYIPSFYITSPHQGGDLDAVVTDRGKPIRVNGEVLTVRKCPAAFRFAIGPARGGEAELLDPTEFSRRYREMIVEYYRFECKQPYDVAMLQYEKHPHPRKFVSKKWNADKSAVIPLGTELPPAAERDEPALLYSPSSDRLISREELDEMKRSQDSREESLQSEVQDLRAKLDALLESKEAAPAKAPKAEKPIVAAPCGKECKGEFGMKAHKRHCKACQEAEA